MTIINSFQLKKENLYRIKDKINKVIKKYYIKSLYNY